MVKGTNEFQERHNKLAALVDSTNAMSVGNYRDEGHTVAPIIPTREYDSTHEAVRKKETIEREREKSVRLKQDRLKGVYYDNTYDNGGEGLKVFLDEDKSTLHIIALYEGGYCGDEVTIAIRDFISFLIEKGAI